MRAPKGEMMPGTSSYPVWRIAHDTRSPCAPGEGEAETQPMPGAARSLRSQALRDGRLIKAYSHDFYANNPRSPLFATIGRSSGGAAERDCSGPAGWTRSDSQAVGGREVSVRRRH